MKIAYLYYDFLNLYGESGNIKIIERILKQNKIKYELLLLSLEDKLVFDDYDLVYIASGTEEKQLIALKHLQLYKKDIEKYINDNKFMLLTGNSLDMFGSSLVTKDNKEIKALGIFDYRSFEKPRIIKEVCLSSSIINQKIIGFINHSYQIDETTHHLFENEGIQYKNVYGTYVLGPLLVRNPEFLKYFLNKVTNQKLKYDLNLEKKAYDHFVKEVL